MAAEPWAGTRSWPTVNAISSAAGDDGFAKSATQTLSNTQCAGDLAVDCDQAK